MARSFGLTATPLLVAGLLMTYACGGQSAGSLGLDDAAGARSALDRLPKAIEAFRGGYYDRASEMLSEIRTELPTASDAATAAVLLELTPGG